MLTYDRQLLLLGAKRNAVLDLSEVLRYGTESYGDANYVSVYGLQPAEWYARGIRLLGRTAVECTRDQLADAIGRDIATTASSTATDLLTGALVIDPFGGEIRGHADCDNLYTKLPYSSYRVRSMGRRE